MIDLCFLKRMAKEMINIEFKYLIEIKYIDEVLFSGLFQLQFYYSMALTYLNKSERAFSFLSSSFIIFFS